MDEGGVAHGAEQLTQDEPDRRSEERDDRRRGERRRSQIAVFIERRFGERRRVPRRLVDVFRTFLGLPPLDE